MWVPNMLMASFIVMMRLYSRFFFVPMSSGKSSNAYEERTYVVGCISALGAHIYFFLMQRIHQELERDGNIWLTE